MSNRLILLKTSSYACMHVVIAFCVAWMVSGSFIIALGISLAEPAVQILGFAIHEKLWARYGKVKPIEGFGTAEGGACAHHHHHHHHKH